MVFSPSKPVIAAVALALVLAAASKPGLAQSLLSPPAGPEGAGAPADNLVIYAPFGGAPYSGLGDYPSQWLEATLPPDWVTAEVAPPPEGPTLEELFQWVESGKGGEAYPLLAERETLELERAAQSGRDLAKLQKEYLIHLLRAGERVAPPEVQERTARRFTEAYPDDPRFPLAYFYLSQALFRQGRPLEESFFFDREALAGLPPWMQTRYLGMKAKAAAARGDFAAAAGYRLVEMISPTTLRETTRDDVLETLSRLRDATLLENFLQEHPDQEWIAAAWPFLRVQVLINGGAMGQALLALETLRQEGLADTPARIKRLHSARTEIENRIATRPRRIGVLLPLGSTHATLRRLALDTLDGLRLGVQFLEVEQPARARLARLLAADPLPLSESPKANGRVAEPSIELVIRDTANIPDQAALEVEKLVREEGVIAIIGPIARSESDAAATRAEELGVPLISLSLTLEIPKGSRFTFRHSKSQEEEVRDLVRYAMDFLYARRFAVLFPDTGYGKKMMELFWEEVESRGGTVVGAASFRPISRDGVDPEGLGLKEIFESFTGKNRPVTPEDQALMDRVGDAKPDAIVDFDALFIPVEPSGSLDLKLIAPYPITVDAEKVILLGSRFWNSEAVLVAGAGKLEGAVFVDALDQGRGNSPATDFRRRHRATFGHRVEYRLPSIYTALGLDTLEIIKHLVAKPENRNRTALAFALRHMEAFPGLTGLTTFRESGEAMKESMFFRFQGDSIRRIKP